MAPRCIKTRCQCCFNSIFQKYLNFEIKSIIHEPVLCRGCELSFEQDKENSHLLTLEEWQSLPCYKMLP